MKVAINMDYGEQIAHLNETSIIGKVDQCSIACGYHAGDASTIMKAMDFCHNNGVSVGVHPSYPDKINFGRKVMHLTPNELLCHLLYQLAAFKAIARLADIPVLHVKLHGALYNEAMQNESVATTTIEATRLIFPEAAIMAMPDSALAYQASKNGFEVWREGFADRLYENAVKLTPRSQDGALITSPEKVKKQIENLKEGYIRNSQGQQINLEVDTICIHGDNPNINEILDVL